VGDKRFWDIIAAACPHDATSDEWGEWTVGLLRELRRLDPEDLVRFGHLFDQKTEAADTSDFVAACFTLNGGAGDDGFYYFRCWLVGMGKRVYEAALADPDTLADVKLQPNQDAEAEIYRMALWVWREERGHYEDEFFALQKKLGLPPITRPDEEGWDTDDDAEFRRRLPRLAARYFSEIDP
jgi:hypothetical protein